MTPEEQEKIDLEERDRVRELSRKTPVAEMVFHDRDVFMVRTPVKKPNWFRRFWHWALLGVTWHDL